MSFIGLQDAFRRDLYIGDCVECDLVYYEIIQIEHGIFLHNPRYFPIEISLFYRNGKCGLTLIGDAREIGELIYETARKIGNSSAERH